MTPYRTETSTRRPMFAFAAIVLTVATFALAVELPASREPAPPLSSATLAGDARSAPPVEVTIHPARIDVIGQRTNETAEVESGERRAPRRT